MYPEGLTAVIAFYYFFVKNGNHLKNGAIPAIQIAHIKEWWYSLYKRKRNETSYLIIAQGFLYHAIVLVLEGNIFSFL